jgi:16S rRNA (cytosine967-C5)-methyltransferase
MSASERVHMPWLLAASQLWHAINASTQPADRVIADWLRAQPAMGKRDRAWVSDLVWGMLRHHYRLDNASSLVAGCEPEHVSLVPVLLHLLLDDADRPLPDRLPASLVETLRRAAVRFQQSPTSEDPNHERALRIGFTPWFMQLLSNELSDNEAETAAQAFAQRAGVTLRVHTGRTTRAAVLASLVAQNHDVTPTVFSPMGIHVASRINIATLPEYIDGLIEVQDEGSQLIALLCQPSNASTIVDACAGAGGKALALAALAPHAKVRALDVSAQRMADLKPRAQRSRARITTALWNEAAVTAWNADIVLVDAPCTGLGTLRRNPDLRRHSNQRLSELGLTQTRILTDCAAQVRPGGVLVYATCSIDSRENERVVEAFLASHRDFTLDDAEPIFQAMGVHGVTGPGGSFMRLWPHRHGTDGFFAARLRRAVPS